MISSIDHKVVNHASKSEAESSDYTSMLCYVPVLLLKRSNDTEAETNQPC
jgi:hypothetical protein